MRSIRLALLLSGTLPRIGSFKSSDDHDHLFQAFLVTRLNQHATHARIYRQAAKLPTDLGEFPVLVQRADLAQRPVSLRHRLRIRWI